MTSLLTTAQRNLGFSFVGIFAVFVVWAVAGELDIVVSAQGKLVPSNFVKISQPVEAGVVTKVLVKDGQVVRKGDLLLQMDDNAYSNDREALASEKSLLVSRLDATRAVLTNSSTSSPSPEIEAEFLWRASALQQSIQTAKASLDKATQEADSIRASISKFKQQLELALSAEQAAKSLFTQGYLSKLSYEEKLKDKVGLEQDLRAAEASLSASLSGAAAARSNLAQLTLDYKKQLSQERSQTLSSLKKTESELAKSQHKFGQSEIRAPADGIVTNIAVKYPGQVVAAGAPLLSIVPAQDPLVAEVWVKNEDAGFFSPERAAKVKLFAYPFQKYGWIEGSVAWVGADSETPDSMKNIQGEPLFYKARIELNAQELVRNAQKYPVKSGMQVQVDVLLGERSLFEYLTSPLKKVALEAARER